jgi:hypothetical protein
MIVIAEARVPKNITALSNVNRRTMGYEYFRLNSIPQRTIGARHVRCEAITELLGQSQSKRGSLRDLFCLANRLSIDLRMSALR